MEIMSERVNELSRRKKEKFRAEAKKREKEKEKEEEEEAEDKKKPIFLHRLRPDRMFVWFWNWLDGCLFADMPFLHWLTSTKQQQRQQQLQ